MSDSPKASALVHMDDSFAQAFSQSAICPEPFFTRVAPTPSPTPYWVAHSPNLAKTLGLTQEAFSSTEWCETLSGNHLFPGSDPLAMVYSGHQFGSWAGQLGDGRALILGKALGQEWQLKGAGKTPYSRMGDGRAVLRSSIREFLGSEAMAGLGVPTTRALAIVGSDLPIFRENVETAAIVTRIAPSFLRFGNFEHWYYQEKPEQLKRLADYLIENHYQTLVKLTGPERYQALLREVCQRTADVVAAWQAFGFCHGVLNTDNMSMLGLTLDYGPFGFMDGFNAHHICNHTDSQGRYAFDQQPGIGEWNCFALGQAFVDIAGGVDEVKNVLGAYRVRFQATQQEWNQRKLGLSTVQPNDAQLMQDLLAQMHESRADFTLTFRLLSSSQGVGRLLDQFVDRERLTAWFARYQARIAQDSQPEQARLSTMQATNPKFILRNHLAETAIRKAADEGDYTEISRLYNVLRHPFAEQPEFQAYGDPAPDWAANLEVSCSS
jgi:serine/tyrosine/threonine adenylyltransferase